MRTPSIVLMIIVFFFSTILPPSKTVHGHCPVGNNFGNGDTPNDPPGSQEQDVPPLPPDSCEETGDPIVIHSGEYRYSHQDIFIPARGIPIDITRTYRSRTAYNGRFGYGWHFTFDIKLRQLEDNNVIIFNFDGWGAKDEFVFDNGNFLTPPGVFNELKRNFDGTFTLTTSHFTRYNFDMEGRLESIQDRNDNMMTFTYDPAGHLPIMGLSDFFNNQGIGVIAYDYMLTAIADSTGRQMSLQYNANGRLTSLSDFSGRVWNYSYDPTGTGDLLTFTTPSTDQFPDGLTTTYTYDEHNITTITDSKNQTFLTNTYTDDRVTRQIYGPGTYTFSHDTENKMMTEVDPMGFVTEYIYDDEGLILNRKEYTAGLRPGEPVFYETTCSYNDDFKLMSITYPKGNGVKYVFDDLNPDPLSRGNLLEIRRKPDMTQPDDDLTDIVARFTYDPNFNYVHSITEPEGQETLYIYNSLNGNLDKITFPEVNGSKPEVLFSYNLYGQIIDITDPNLNMTAFNYFSTTGYLWKVNEDPQNYSYVTSYSYDDVGNTTSVTDARQATTSYKYDELDQIIKIVSAAPFNHETKLTYDGNGNITRIEKQSADLQNPWQVLELTYTSLNDIVEVRQYLGASNYLRTLFHYDANGNRDSLTNPNNKVTHFEYDERNLIWKATDALNGTIQFDYTFNGKLSKIVDARLNSTTFEYDDFDRIKREMYADYTFKDYAYDKNSNLIELINPRGDKITYVYDNLNRLDLKDLPGAYDVDYEYDIGSRLTSVAYNNTRVDLAYDTLNRINSTINTLDGYIYFLVYGYDEVGNRTQVTYPNGDILEYSYDILNRMSGVVQNTKMIANYTYDALSRRKRVDLANRTFAEYEYDMADRLTKLVNNAYNYQPLAYSSGGKSRSGPPTAVQVVPESRILSSFSYTYDNVGNRLDMTTTDGVYVYGYDVLDQLTGVTYPIGSQTTVDYDYDLAGNRKVVTIDGNPVNYLTNIVNQYIDVGGQAYSYDGNGSLESTGVLTFNYDCENRLLSVIGNGNTTEYEYDGLGRRISRKNNGVKKYYIYDNYRVVEEMNSDGSLDAKYIYGSELDEVLSMQRDNKEYYYHYDGLGSVVAVSSKPNQLVEQYRYDVYGQPSIYDGEGNLLSESGIKNPILFTGRVWDDATEIYDYRMRDYSPEIGRFLQRDPLGYLGGLNLYTYVKNNPIVYVDPMGLSCTDSNETGQDWIDYYLDKTGGDYEEALYESMRGRRQYPDDLVLRDAEHYLFTYNETFQSGKRGQGWQWGTSAFWMITTAGYSGAKWVLSPLRWWGVWKTTPPTWSEVWYGWRGTIEGKL